MIAIKDLHKFSQSLRALYVEDDPALRTHMREMLKSLFENVEVAIDGLDGLIKYNENEYDIVLTDVDMPKMNGVEMIARIREINPEQKIIVLSALSESEVLIDLMQQGVNSFLLKPIKMQSLLNVLYPIARDADTQRENIELYKILNDERELLKKKIKLLEAQNNATAVKHEQLGRMIQEKNAIQSNDVLDQYFKEDDDEGYENVLFMEEDCDELIELFNEMPEFMLQYLETKNMVSINHVLEHLAKVSSILLHYTPYLDALAESFSALKNCIEENLEHFSALFETSPEGLLMLWDAVSRDMEHYVKRFSLESMAMRNIHHIHAPTCLSVQQIITLISPEDEEMDSGEIEFF